MGVKNKIKLCARGRGVATWGGIGGAPYKKNGGKKKTVQGVGGGTL